jgi:patatin-like phospholipase
MRRYSWLLPVLLAWALLMMYTGRTLPKHSNVKGITGAGLVMEFAQEPLDVERAFQPDDGAPTAACKGSATEIDACKRSGYRSTLLLQQALDVVFILLYWAFFFCFGKVLRRTDPPNAPALGRVMQICMSVAAISDLIEDAGIWRAVSPGYDGAFWPYPFALLKWFLVFAVFAVVGWALLRFPRLGDFDLSPTKWIVRLARLAGLLFALSGVLGIAGTAGRIAGNGQLLTLGALGMLIAFPLVTALFLAGLKPLSSVPAFSFRQVLARELQEIARLRDVRAQSFADPAMPADAPADPLLIFPAREGKQPGAVEPVDPAIAIGIANHRALSGLALSGGGIRSATFNLGVLQGLAQLKFLRRFDYLSTISGGGYIGSWLISWIKRRGMREVEFRLGAPRVKQTPGYKEPPEIRFLREYSNYLTPRLGVLGADTWTAIATYLRNLILNQSILVLFIAACLLAPWALTAMAYREQGWLQEHVGPLGIALVLFAGPATFVILQNMWQYTIAPSPSRVFARVLANADNNDVLLVQRLGLAGQFDELLQTRTSVEIWTPHINRRRNAAGGTIIRSFDPVTGALRLASPVTVEAGDLVIPVYRWVAKQRWISALVAVPTFLGAVVLCCYLSSATTLMKDHGSASTWASIGAGGLFLLWLLMFGAAYWALDTPRRGRASQRVAIAIELVSPLASGAVGGVLLWKTTQILQSWSQQPDGAWRVLGFGAPLIALVLLLVTVVHTGLLGTAFDDPRREWWGRLTAWLLIVCGAWAADFALAGYSPLLLLWLRKFPTSFWMTALGWAGTTVAGILGGQNAKSSGTSPGWKEALLGVTPYVFILGLLILVATGLHSLPFLASPVKPPDLPKAPPSQMSVRVADSASAQKEVEFKVQAAESPASKTPGLPWKEYWATFESSLKGPDGNTPLLALLGCLALTLILALRVDLNEFSMHYFYRNRLVRCYLGATNRERVPNPFTGFDSNDDVFLAKLTAMNSYDGPYPILGCALNLVHGKDLAWQERKAASFVMSPLHCGYDVWFEKLPRPGQWEKAGRSPDAYRPTQKYAYPGGFFVGTAMSISGAAASPNMGYHSSPALSFLMTIFNVRLGWWVGNPRHPLTWKKAGPDIGLGYLLAELFGATDDARPYVYLSDGGHFENLGLYELVKRRCRFIIASDAAEDKDMRFGDLASAIRKCRSDMGIDIKIRTDHILVDPKNKCSRWHCAVGEIMYKQSDPAPDAQNGILIYIKASLTSDESCDVLNYKATHDAFPHQPTTDQWFTESQFESYRALGEHIAQTLFEDVKGVYAGDLSQIPMEELFTRIGELWENPESIEAL